jgi:lysophospholipase L1-like esterase
MNKLYLLACLVMPLVVNAQLAPNYHRLPAPPKVVFIGDYFTYNWTSGFAANPNWINKGINGTDFAGQHSYDMLARFQSDVVSLHPAIVHIMMGAIDSELSSPASTQYTPPGFATTLDAIVKQAKAANIKVILGISPGTDYGWDTLMPQINSIVQSYGAANNIEVVNYADALCQCVGALGQNTEVSNAFQQMTTSVPSGALNAPTLLPTAAGYALMSKLAEAAIANEYLILETGWLSNVAIPDDNIGLYAGDANLNTVSPAAVLQFIPIGYYSDGSQHPLTNTTWEGATGTWTSSNPLVMSVSQQGLAFATTSGTAIIHYTSPTGVAFSEWIMYVTAP